MPEERIYGVDRGPLPEWFDPETASERLYWRLIEDIGGFLHASDYGHHERSASEMEAYHECNYAIQFLVYNAGKRFGFVTSEPSADKWIDRTAEYNKWYRYWGTIIEELQKVHDGLSDADKKIFYADMDAENYAKYVSTGDWRQSES